MRPFAYLLAAGLISLLAACGQSSPAGAAGGTSAAETVGEGAGLNREKSLRTDQTARSGATVPAASVIFGVLNTRLPLDIDAAMAKRGAAAIAGPADQRVLQAFTLAGRPVVAWPLDPLEHTAAAKRWAGAIAAAVVVANRGAAVIAAEVTASASRDAGDMENRVLAAFNRLDHRQLARQLDEVAAGRVVLDLAEAAAVRMALSDGASLLLDASGATLVSAGAVRFSTATGVLDGAAYQVAQEMTQQATLARSRVLTSTGEAGGGTNVGATAGVR